MLQDKTESQCSGCVATSVLRAAGPRRPQAFICAIPDTRHGIWPRERKRHKARKQQKKGRPTILARKERGSERQGCQMDIAKFFDFMSLALWA